MTLPDHGIIEATPGYHPGAGDAADRAGTRLFSDMLVLGNDVPDVHGRVGAHHNHMRTGAPESLPAGAASPLLKREAHDDDRGGHRQHPLTERRHGRMSPPV